MVDSSRIDPSCSITNAGSMLPVAMACSAVAMRMAMVAFAACALLDEQARHERVVDGLLARHFARHELELAVAAVVAEEARDVDVDALGAILIRAHGHGLTFFDSAAFAYPEVAVLVEHEHGVHA